MNCLEIKTSQTNAFKQLMEALKEILTDANIEFTPSGMKLVAMDSSKTVLVHLKLIEEKFETYNCNNTHIVGVNLSNLHKLIKMGTNQDTLELFINNNDQNNLGIRFANSQKNFRTTLKMKMMDIDEQKIEIPPAEFDSIITMPSVDFQKICRDCSNLTDVIEIKSVGTQLIFTGKGGYAEYETVIGETDEGVNFTKTNDISKIIQGFYNLKHLTMFTKCTGLCNNIEIYMKNNFPIVISYGVGNLGKLKLALAPKIPDSE